MDRDVGADTDDDMVMGSAFTLEFEPFSLPLSSPLETANGTIETRRGFLVKASDETTSGIGEATPLPGFTESYDECEVALEDAREAMGVGGPGMALAAVDESVAARHAVSLAMADWKTTHDAIPLYQTLGSPGRVARVPVNATIGDGSPDETAAAAVEAVDSGYFCVKVKVGNRDVETDVERVRRVRDAVGSEVELRTDANGAWTYETAESAVIAFDELDVSIIEQPLPPGALGGHTSLRELDTDVSVALDEGLLEHGVDRITNAEAADAVILKPMALGGVDAARGLAAWAIESELTPIVTTTIDSVVARTAAVHLAASIPNVPACGLATADFLATDLGRDPVLFERGAAVVPQAKGLGITDVWDGA